MSPSLHRLARIAAMPVAALAAAMLAMPASAHETGMPHPAHAYEGWAAVAVVVLALTGAAWLIRRAFRR